MFNKSLLCRNQYIFKISSLCSSTGCFQNEVSQTFSNRNPRNLEKLRIARKPDGYFLDKPGRNFWHKLELIRTNHYITARVIHNTNGTVVTASTTEWAIKKQLYRFTDTSAYMNLGTVLAQRCLKFGITEMMCIIQPFPGGKVEKFLNNVRDGGVSLEEPERYKVARPWDKHRPEKPWEVEE